MEPEIAKEETEEFVSEEPAVQEVVEPKVVETINQEYSYATALLAILKNDATVAQEKIASLEGICNKYKLAAEEYNRLYEEFSVELAVLNEEAAEMGLLTKNEKGDYALISKYEAHTIFVKEIFAEATAKKEAQLTTKYTCDDGSIVVVTYGGKDGDDNAPYRTFILNYNIFAVTVKYNGVEYTLEPYGYQIIDY